MFKHNNWIVFPNTEPKEDILHCSNTVSGVCENTSLEQCIDICDNSPNCNSGYHVDGRCLATDKTNFPFYFNPALYWKESSANVTAFIDNDEIPYPPIFSDSVFFTDTVFLKNVEKKLVLNTPFATVSKSDETITPINFTEKYGSVLTVSYSNPFNPGVIQNTNLIYKYPFVLRIKNSNYILRVIDGNLSWILRGNTEIQGKDKLSIYPVNPTKDQRVRYYDNFYMMIGYNGILGLDSDDKFNVYYNNTFQSLQNSGVSVTFTFVPQVNVFYCDNGECKDIPLSEAKRDGRMIFRRNDCFNTCSKKNEKVYVYNTIVLIVIVLMVVIVLLKN